MPQWKFVKNLGLEGKSSIQVFKNLQMNYKLLGSKDLGVNV